VRLLLILLCAACEDRTSALIDIEGAMPLASLDLTVKLPETQRDYHLGALTPPRNLLILLPDVAQKIDLTLTGVETGGRAVGAQASFTSNPHHQVPLTMRLGGPGDDLSMPPDLAGADLTGYVEDLAGADLTPAGDLAGADFAQVPQLSVLSGALGAAVSYDGVGRDARLSVPQMPALAGTSLYAFELYTGRLRKVDVTTGAVTTIPLINAADSQPFYANAGVGLVSDGQGHLYVACFGDHTIRKVNLADSHVTLLAGAANMSGSTDSPPRFNNPQGLALDANGDLWVADSGNDTIRRISLAGPTVTTIAGSPGVSDFADGTGSAGHFKNPQGLAFQNGDLYVTDADGLRKVQVSASPSPAPVSTVLADGTWLNGMGVASAGGGILYVIEASFQTLRQVNLAGPASQMVVAGVPAYQQDFVDGVGVLAHFIQPRWLVLDGAGAAYVTEGGAVRKVDLGNFNVTTLAGMSPQDDNTDSPRPRFANPAGLYFDGNDTLYVADYANNRIRKLALSTNTLTTLAGNGDYSSTDGNGTSASFYSPISVTGDSAGNLYVADSNGHCIRKVTPSLDVSTIAGTPPNSGPPSPSPVPGAMATFYNPDGLAFDGDHTLWVADDGNNVLRAIDLSSPQLTTTWIAGSGSSGAITGVGRAARFASPRGLAWDSAAKILYVADNGSGLVRRVDMTNPAMPNVTNLAGVPFPGAWQDGTFSTATFGQLGHLALDPTRHILWASDYSNDLVRRLDLQSQMVTSPIGVVQAQLTKPGPLPAFISTPWGIQITPRGLVISSWDENALMLATGL
jgi:sugar lactone lactonase YvrE